MAGRIRNFQERDGRYYARLVVPRDLRPYLKRTELRTPLGADRRQAIARLPTEVAKLQHRIAVAEREAAKATGKVVDFGRYPLADNQIALLNYQERLILDDQLRSDHRYANVGIDDRLVIALREGMAGRLSDQEITLLVGDRIDRYTRLGNVTAKPNTDEWRGLARVLCASEYEALSRAAERDEGDYTGVPSHPVLVNAKPIEAETAPISIRSLFDRHIRELRMNGVGDAAEKRWRPVIEDLVDFAKTDDANKITRKTILDWKDAKLATLSPRTIKDVYLASVKAIFNCGVMNELIASNPAHNIKVKVAAKQVNRPKGFTRAEAETILGYCLSHQPSSHFGKPRELPQTTAAKRWAPLLCAYTGSRITEITQLREQDVRQEGAITIIRITPEAGTVKTRQYRDVPLHPQIIELGFLDFVKNAPAGPLFFRTDGRGDTSKRAGVVARNLCTWLKKAGIIPDGVQPNHAWRHAFKTTGRELGIDTRILDAIQGHAARTAGDDYGDVTIAAMQRAIKQFPSFDLHD